MREMIMEGVLSIQSGENPRLMEHKLKHSCLPNRSFSMKHGQCRRDKRGKNLLQRHDCDEKVGCKWREEKNRHPKVLPNG
jgi:hypothetical protein